VELIADILLVAGALGAGFYCYILARRLSRFNDLEKGVGGAVAVLSAQVDDLNKALIAAQATSEASSDALGKLTERAETVSHKLELMVASMHDLSDTSPGSKVKLNGHAVPSQPEPPTTNRPVEAMFTRHSRSDAGGGNG
jgi:hypothetical protein